MNAFPKYSYLARPVSWIARVALFLLPLALLGGYFYGSDKLFLRVTKERELSQNDDEPDGSRLYVRHCSQCHGVKGNGQGTAALTPPARHFGYEKFRFASTDNGVPTDDDLLYLLKNGIEGSSMPSFRQLHHEELLAIIGHVRQLARKGFYDRLVAEAKKQEEDGGDEVNLTKISESVTRRSVIGKALAIPSQFPEATVASKANGKKIFQTACASCHGPEGRGDGQQTKDPKFVNENGTKAYPRDLTAGMYKAGGEHAKLYARIMLGIPGTPMPASKNLPAADILDLVNYIRALPSETPAKLTAGK